MNSALLVGGTRFMGRQTVEELLSHGYDVTTFTRGESGDPFVDREGVSNYRGDRNDREALVDARDAVESDVVIDFCGMFPRQIEAATELFADVDAYVYVSSGSAYAENPVPMREETPLHECSEKQAEDESMETYGPRKAKFDRVCFAAANEGVNALVARPMLIYGPHDYTERFDYWLHRVATFDRVLVPGDGSSLLHQLYAVDGARALRILADRGAPGEAYNVADRETVSLDRSLELAADAFDTDLELVHASERELARRDLSPTDFPLYTPSPAVVSTEKLARLGWESTPLADAFSRTVEEHAGSGRTGEELGPARETELALIEELTG
ncbi:NAD-dependent epimerase/dehydratase family protein [Haladaptatus halobius]|uniref:NAD-dependent epimerase/dehydratase family protein n=1 Tax=Haladaptatus halobius TaxID=2884875 RepID=UPI001D09F45D|nr:NAD-dependent epimerase/dehydratase family protein [Haladaptatus halobius]